MRTIDLHFVMLFRHLVHYLPQPDSIPHANQMSIQAKYGSFFKNFSWRLLQQHFLMQHDQPAISI